MRRRKHPDIPMLKQLLEARLRVVLTPEEMDLFRQYQPGEPLSPEMAAINEKIQKDQACVGAIERLTHALQGVGRM
jgi:hypothetical protein